MDLNSFESVRKLRKTAFNYCCGIALGLSAFILIVNIVFFANFVWYLLVLTVIYSILMFTLEERFIIKGFIINLLGLSYILSASFPTALVAVLERSSMLLLIPLSMVGLISGSFFMLIFGLLEILTIFLLVLIIDIPDYKVINTNILITGIALLIFWFLVRSLENALRQSLHLQTNLQNLVDERTAQLAVSVHEAKSAQYVAEQANLRKSQFLATMSHELRTPLNAIINMTEFIDWFGPLNSQQKSYQDQVRGAGEHLLHLINDILDLSKIEAGRVELHFGNVDCAAIAQEVLETVRPLAEAKGLQVDYRQADQLDLAWADSKAIKQIVLNLLSNAIKFTETGRISVALESTADTVMVVIHDTGIGIALEHQQFIWESFRQIQSSDDREYEGTGLGMSITKQLVDLHGGDITVESEVDRGTQFRVCLPTKAAWQQRHSIYTHAASKQTMVVVDDNPNTVEEFGIQLATSAWRIIGCLDSREALAIYRREQPTLVVLDATLAFVSAHSLIDEMLVINPDQAIVIVAPNNEYSLGLESWPHISRPWPQALEPVLQQTVATAQQQRQLATIA